LKKNEKTRLYFKVFDDVTFSIFLLMLIVIVVPDVSFSQSDTVWVSSDLPPGEGNLNTAVKMVTDNGNLSNTIFMLEPNGLYVWTDSIFVPAGEHLMLIGPEPGLTQETGPPQLLCSNMYDYPSKKKYLFYCNGDLTLKNLWLLYANTNGEQKQVSLQIADSPGVVYEQKGIFENIIFDYSSIPQNASGAVGISAKHFSGTFKNCYWRNCTDPHYRYYGRAISFPFSSTGYHIDSLTFENCTFANIGYVYMQEGGEYGDNVHFNHCTFLNVVMFTLESGWWYKMSVTNSAFVNTFMYGAMPVYDGEGFGGTLSIDAVNDFGFSVPFSKEDRRILFAHNSYALDPWLVDWMGYGPNGNPYSQYLHEMVRDDEIPVPMPMINSTTRAFFDSTDEHGNKVFSNMNSAALYDSSNPGFIHPPTDTTAVKSFLRRRWDDGSDTSWAWKPENSLNQVWPLEENLAYANDTLLTAGMSGFPLGDLYHWFPEKYRKWKAQEHSEKAQINHWLESGKDPGIVGIYEPEIDRPVNFKLYQNYPNPFNPTTQIKYTNLKNSYISLKVYNVLGQEVTTLFEGFRRAGNYEVVFDGRGFASGVYIYRMKANTLVQTKKLLLLR